ncbi:MAG: methyltransferase domain-containing protein [Archangium sp.]
MKNDAWWFDVLVCPACGGALCDGGALARCDECGPFPVLAGVPVLVADPYSWCARFRESILATLAEFDAADAQSVEVVRAFAGESNAAPELFGDDWTEHELRGEAAPVPVKGPAATTLKSLFAQAGKSGPGAWLAAHMQRALVAVEVGCGAGERSEMLAMRADKLVVADLSLRAVLTARKRAARFRADVFGVVMDAENLPLAPKSVDVLMAEHVVDLLDAPEAFFESAAAAVTKKGRVLVTTPDPMELEDLAAEAKLKVIARADGLPWLRVNSERFVELYLVRALALAPR